MQILEANIYKALKREYIVSGVKAFNRFVYILHPSIFDKNYVFQFSFQNSTYKVKRGFDFLYRR